MTAEKTYERIPYLIVFHERSFLKDTFAGEIGKVLLEAHLLRPSKKSNSVVIFSHPVGNGAYLPLPNALARNGVHVIYCNTRFRGNDSALTMEKAVLDLGACVRDAKERLGYEKVYLGGWSGGGALSLFYQAEAQDPSVTHTPAGDPIDLVSAKFIPADGVMLLAAHLSRNRTLTEFIDPSIVDETRPFDRDPSLNLYGPEAPKPPYSDEFIARYRAAQIERNRRITVWVKDELKNLTLRGFPHDERCFVVQGTLADPRFLDTTLEPNGRRPNWCFLGEPRAINDAPVGLARFCSLRSWLSQWAYDESNADGLRCAARIETPLLVVENGADDACMPSHAARLMEAADRCLTTYHLIEGANHYYFGQPELAQIAAELVVAWLATLE